MAKKLSKAKEPSKKEGRTLEIRIWSEGDEFPDNFDLPEFFREHAAHVAHSLEQGNIQGEICPDGNFRGWWAIVSS